MPPPWPAPTILGRLLPRSWSTEATGRWSGHVAEPKHFSPTRLYRHGWNTRDRGRRQLPSRGERASPQLPRRPLAAQYAEPDPRSRFARREYRKDGTLVRTTGDQAAAACQDA